MSTITNLVEKSIVTFDLIEEHTITRKPSKVSDLLVYYIKELIDYDNKNGYCHEYLLINYYDFNRLPEVTSYRKINDYNKRPIYKYLGKIIIRTNDIPVGECILV